MSKETHFLHLFSHSWHSFEHPKIGHHQTQIPHVYHCFQLHFWGSTIFTSTSTVNFPHFSVCESTFGCLTWLRRGFPRIHHAVFRMVWTLQPHLARRHSRPEIRFFNQMFHWIHFHGGSNWLHSWLVVSNIFLFFTIYGIILPIDELIFFKMVIAPPTRSTSLQFIGY
jgi:hypothetical protein